MPSSKKRKSKHRPAPKAKRSVEAEDALQWISSNSEPEDYGNLGGKERWEVDGIIDSHRGENDRMSYKIRWNKNDWRREDGTSEEWIPAPKRNSGEHQTLIRKYESREFNYFDSKSCIVAEEDELHSHIHGYPSVSKDFWQQAGMEYALAKHEILESGDLRKAGISIFDINDRNFARGEHGSESDDESQDEVAPLPPPRRQSEARQPKREPSVDERPPPSPSLGGSRNASQIVDSDRPSLLDELASNWTERAESVGAAFITFTNDTKTPHAIPRLKDSFEYNEMHIDWGSENPVGTDTYEEGFASCRCSDQCDRPGACNCQDPLFEEIVTTPRAMHKFAYNRKGLFRLEHQGVVIECNKRCRCASNCPNRVAQQPRSIPLDIFTPSIYGWGVRPLRSVKAGQVLGTFTGEIISRAAAQKKKHCVGARLMSNGESIEFTDHNQYLFDLDARHNRYTLNCWRIGNWTRFINHCCDPNLRVYPVCYDTLPETGLERLAVVAKRDIRALEELTIDYHPSEVIPASTHHKDLTQCRCGAQNCRGVTTMVGN